MTQQPTKLSDAERLARGGEAAIVTLSARVLTNWVPAAKT
jgi:hypothetical protein